MNHTQTRNVSVLFGTWALFTAAQAAAAPPVVSEATLLGEMTRREALARLDGPAYVTRQFSSYDRASVAPGKAGWYGNDDWSMFIRTETRNGRTEHVMMEAEGPGAIVRFWMTFAGPAGGEGTLRIYIDGEDDPAVEAPAREVLSGGVIAPWPLSASVSEQTPYERRGHNLYYPIPYAKRCKVTYESPGVYAGTDPARRKGSENVYYNIECRTYVDPVTVHPFAGPDRRKTAAAKERAAAMLAAQTVPDAKGIAERSLSALLHPGRSATLKIDGARAIREMTLRIDARDLPQALRSTVLSMRFDGEQTVWVPVGELFGIGYEMVPSATYFTQTDGKNTMRSYWVMPFGEDCEIALHNFGSQDVSIEGRISHSAWEWDERSLHFGVSWHQYPRLKTGSANRTAPRDIMYTELAGTGRYVGDCLTLYNTVNGWWGEGDEKIYVDGEAFPSHFGTGTEDYYGYAWCRPEPFTRHPFIGQPSGGGNLGIGYTANCRFRALDAIPFTRSLRFDMEIWHWQETEINYAPTTIWYMRPGGRCTVRPDTAEVRRRVATERRHIIPAVLTAGIEGEDCEILELTAGKAYGQYRTNELWSRNTQLFWHDAPVGARLTLAFESPFEAQARIEGLCSMAVDYGTFRISLNGKELVGRLDLYAPELVARAIPFGEGAIRQGTNTLTIEALAPAGHFRTCFFGLDRLNIEPLGD